MKSRRYSRVTCLLRVEELETRLTPAPVVLQPDLQITNIGTASDGPPAQMDFGPDGRLYMTLANTSGPNAASVESFAYSPSGGLSDERTEVSTGGALGIGFGPVSLGVYGQPGVKTVTGMYLTDTARTINGNDVSNLRVLTQDQNGVWGGPNGGTDTIIVQNIPAGWHQADQIIIKQNADGTSTLYVGIGVRTKDGALAYPNPGDARDMAYGGTISEILDLKQVNGLVTDSAGFGLTGVATSNSDPDYSNAGPYTSTAVNKLIVQSAGTRNPFGLALDGSGNLWFTNNFNRSQSDGTFNGTIDPSTGLLYGITTGDPAPGPDLANNAYDQFFEAAPLADYGYNNSNWRNDAADDNPSVTSEAAVNAGFFNFAEHGVRSTTFDNLVAPPGGFAEYNESNINQIQGLGPSASADGVAFYTGTTFPATYQGDAFIARYNGTVSDSTGHSITYNDLVTVDPTTGNVRIIANNFDNPLAVLYDGSGNMIIADYGDSAIYRLSPKPTPPPPATASFLKLDSTTEGNWTGVYGTQGYDIVSGPSKLPSNDTVTPSGQATYTWTTTSSDPRALQVPGSSNRVAAVWYSSTKFTVDVNLADGQAHDLELYFDDWDNMGRAETVQISDATSGTVLDTETISSFVNGVYLDWKVSGNLVITITRTAGANAVLNGVFLDPSSTALFVRQDAATQGTWIGTYGTQGYVIVSGPSKLPSNDTVTPSGQATYTWTTTSSDSRALQVPGSSNRVAAVWYSSTKFTVDVNLADGLTHDLELYFDDWDNKGRAETVQISDATSGAVLSTQSISSFQSGVYLDYAVSGNIVITITRTAGANAVLNGVFLDPSSTALPVRQDTATQGTWIGTYGTQGYDIVSGPSKLPSNDTVTPSGQATYTWTTTSSDPRALQVPGSSNRVAAVWYSSTKFTVDVNLADGLTHNLELYFDDWDNKGRAETVQISDATSGAVLSTQSISSFQSGVYLDYAVSGNIVITITRTAGANAVLNGVFLDPTSSPPPTATASFLKQDTTTQGSWTNTYGTQGYDIVSGPSKLPSNDTVTPSGQATYTWTTTSSDPRALQVPGSSNRVAAVWYSSTKFTVDVNLADGQAHNLELYFDDWDNMGRAETVQISDATSGTVLDTETISSFVNGVYLDWKVSGNLVITITRTAGANAVLNGVFLG